MRIENTMALLDVDDTLYISDSKVSREKVLNTQLLESLKQKGIRDIYLFTDMTFSDSIIEDREKLIKELEVQGFTVEGVITPADYLWKRRKKYKDFYSKPLELRHLVDKARKGELTEKLKEAADLIKKDDIYNMHTNRDTAAGSAYKEISTAHGNWKLKEMEGGVKDPETIDARENYHALAKAGSDCKMATDLCGIYFGSPSVRALMHKHWLDTGMDSLKLLELKKVIKERSGIERKGFMYEVFLDSKPAKVKHVIFADDKPKEISAVFISSIKLGPGCQLHTVKINFSDPKMLSVPEQVYGRILSPQKQSPDTWKKQEMTVPGAGLTVFKEPPTQDTDICSLQEGVERLLQSLNHQKELVLKTKSDIISSEDLKNVMEEYVVFFQDAIEVLKKVQSKVVSDPAETLFELYDVIESLFEILNDAHSALRIYYDHCSSGLSQDETQDETGALNVWKTSYNKLFDCNVQGLATKMDLLRKEYARVTDTPQASGTSSPPVPSGLFMRLHGIFSFKKSSRSGSRENTPTLSPSVSSSNTAM